MKGGAAGGARVADVDMKTAHDDDIDDAGCFRADDADCEFEAEVEVTEGAAEGADVDERARIPKWPVNWHEDLRTVVLFYNKYNSKSAARQINPETGQEWAAPEVPDTISWPELETGPAMDDQRIDALVAFMKTLTDARYEDLLEEE